MIEIVESDFLAVCEEGIYEISKEINKELNENIHIALIDHLQFAVKRMKSKEMIENPFLVEIETLYPKNLAWLKWLAIRYLIIAK
jgi:transcriptional antiterminator